jgi:hypothetical protein
MAWKWFRILAKCAGYQQPPCTMASVVLHDSLWADCLIVRLFLRITFAYKWDHAVVNFIEMKLQVHEDHPLTSTSIWYIVKVIWSPSFGSEGTITQLKSSWTNPVSASIVASKCYNQRFSVVAKSGISHSSAIKLQQLSSECYTQHYWEKVQILLVSAWWIKSAGKVKNIYELICLCPKTQSLKLAWFS